MSSGADVPKEAPLALLREHLGRFVPQMDTDRSARSAVKAVVNQLGERLGFTALHDADDVDVWSSPTGAVLVVCPAAAGELPARLRLLMQSRDRVLADRGLPARKGSALGVICGTLVNWRHIEEAAGVHRTGDHVRVISLDALLSLAELRAEQGLAHTDAVTLLRPQGVRADAVVEMLTRGLRRAPERHAARLEQGSERAVPDLRPGPARSEWVSAREDARRVPPSRTSER